MNLGRLPKSNLPATNKNTTMKSKNKKPVGFFIEAYDTFYTEQNRRFLCNNGEWSDTVLLGNYGGALKLYKHEKRAINRAHALRHEAQHIRINYIYEGEGLTMYGDIIKPNITPVS